MKNLNFSLVFQMTKCSSWRFGAFSVAFNRDTAITFLFLWGTEIWGKHNSLLRSSDNCSLSWLVLQPFVSLHPTSLHPSVLRFSHSFFCFSLAKQQSTNPQRKINCSKKKKKRRTKEKNHLRAAIFKAKLQTLSLCLRCQWTPACGFRKGRVPAARRRLGVGVVLEAAICGQFVLHWLPWRMERRGTSLRIVCCTRRT